MSKSEIKLYIGCGPLPIHSQHLKIIDDSWTLIDSFVEDEAIVKMDARDLKYGDNTVSHVYSSHLLEHVSHHDVHAMLQEWLRVLVPGGRVTINVPDIEWASRTLISMVDGKKHESKLYVTPHEVIQMIMYGSQIHDGEYHKSGYTDFTLLKYLEDAGFIDIIVDKKYEAHEMGCLIANATKP
jgi:predicted SAM-dependent methyltransferase